MAIERALQDTYGPRNACFGCGPSNPKGLRIKSFARGDEVVADWQPEPFHEAFPGVLCGGIIGTLLDCHSNWAAAYHLMRRASADRVPYTVTAAYAITMLKPTPTKDAVHLSANVVEATDHKAVVEAKLIAGGEITATCRGTFVAVREGHPAYGRW